MANRQRIIRLIFLSFIVFVSKNSFAASGPGIYSEATDVFEFIDNASGWHMKTSMAYRSALEAKFKLTSEENSLLKKYAEIRKREAENSEMNAQMIDKDDAFGRVPFGYDHFSKAFYTSLSIRDALLKLKQAGVPQEDVQFIFEMIKKLKPKLESFLKESIQFNVKLIEFNKQWKYSKRDRALKYFESFVLGKLAKKLEIRMLPVWSPADVLPTVDLRGHNLILRYNPLTQTDNWDYTDISKKAILAVLAAQPLAQRENLSKLFKLKCNGREFELQESLQIAFGVMMPKYIKERKKFNLYERWSSRTFIDVYSKLLFPLMDEHVKKKGSFPGFFMEQSSFLCHQLHQLAVTP